MALAKIISLRWKKGIPRLVVPDKFEPFIKWILRGLALLGIVAGFFTLSPFFGLLLSLCLLAIEQFFERTVFQYLAIYVQPLPEFKYDSDEWEGMAFAWSEDPAYPLMVGPQFKSREYAEKFWSLIRSWNYNEDEDKENNVRLSFIVDGGEYRTFIYPSRERKTIKEFAKSVDDDLPREEKYKEQFLLVSQIIFCKLFKYGPNIKNFMSRYCEGNVYLFGPFVKDAAGTISPLQTSRPLLKSHCKAQLLSDLPKKDFERSYIKMYLKMMRQQASATS